MKSLIKTKSYLFLILIFLTKMTNATSLYENKIGLINYKTFETEIIKSEQSYSLFDIFGSVLRFFDSHSQDALDTWQELINQKIANTLPVDIQSLILSYIEPTESNAAALLKVLEKLRELKALQEPLAQSTLYYNKLYNLNNLARDSNKKLVTLKSFNTTIKSLFLNSEEIEHYLEKLVDSIKDPQATNHEKLFSLYSSYIAQYLKKRSRIETKERLDNYLANLSPVSQLLVEKQALKVPNPSLKEYSAFIAGSPQFKVYAVTLATLLFFYYSGIPLDITKFLIDISITLSFPFTNNIMNSNYIWIIAATFSAYNITGDLNIPANLVKAACPFASIMAFIT